MHQRLGEAALSEGNYTTALEEFLIAVEKNPREPMLHLELGVAYYSKGRLEEARRHLLRAVELKPDLSEAHNNLGLVYTNQGLYESAIREYRLALQNVLYPTPEKVFQNLSVTSYLKGDCEGALAASRSALQFRPDHPIYLNGYGLALHCLKRSGEAEEAFRRALTANPDYVEAHLSLGNLLAETGRRDEARAEYQSVIRLAPYSPAAETARSRLGMVK
ncbi:MAG: tetratricopeptide repeat protein [Nitrospirae bacterium]|nr:tetratricopeptide repeat protein [Nitrospirota bacterium]